MDTNENLEIHFSVNPRLAISIKLIAAYGRGVTQKTFVNESCPTPWLNTLNDIAAAIKREASPQDANASWPYQNTPSETSSTHSPPATDQVNSTSLEHRSLINNAPMLASPYAYATPNNFYGDGQAAGGFFSDSVSPSSPSSNNCTSSRNTPDPPSSVMLQTASINGLDMFSVEQQLHMSLLYRSPMDDFYPSGPPTFSTITPPRTTPISSRQSPEIESTAASPTHRRAHSFPTSSGTESEGATSFQGNASIEVEMLDPSSTEYYRSNTTREFSYFTSTPRSKLMMGDAMDSRDQALRERLRKLEILLKEVEEQPIPSPRDHNEKVLRLTANQDSPLDDTPMSAEEFGQLLSRLGNVYSSAGVIYSLLSWEIYRWEEERLTQKENLPEIVAAKRINDKMSESTNRRTRYKDWASDGRKAARMAFGALAPLSAVSRSFALLALADIVSSDGLLKIAHSPACRQRFSERFVEITRARQAEWEALPRKEYLLFDYKIFLQRKWLSRQQNSWEDIETMLGSDPGNNQRPLEFSFPTSPISY